MSAQPAPLTLDGESLTLADLVRAARDPRVEVRCTPAALVRVERGRRLIDEVARRYREDFARHQAQPETSPPVQDYGVTTGFGEFKNVPIAPEQLETLQQNLLLSHCVGVGESAEADDPASYFPAEVVRGALLTRLNAFLKGCSGVSPALVEVLQAMLNRGVIPLVPLRGSVGASGDLCPLSHLFAVLVGYGRYYRVLEPADLALPPGRLQPAAELAADLGVPLPRIGYKEGLALTNGGNVSAALLALAVHDAELAAAAADVAAGLSLEALCGCARALDPKVHQARGHHGQEESAANLRALLAGSRLLEAAGAVQDAYSLRCAPPVHGASRDAIAYARMVAERELNAATDNPLFFPGEDGAAHASEPWDWGFRNNWPGGYDGTRRSSYSAGNFHGQPLALAADFLAIALAELASISERRTQTLLDCHHSRNLPANLVAHRGVNSGLMIAQYTAASLVSENKVLAHPASVDSIPTSANSEDHVSMSPIAARKLRTVLGNVQATLAIELMVAAQAVEWRVGLGLPATASPERAPARQSWQAAEDEAAAFRHCTAPEQRAAIAARLGHGTAAAYLAVRQHVPPLVADRPLDGDVRSLRRLIAEGRLTAAVDRAVPGALRPIRSLAPASG